MSATFRLVVVVSLIAMLFIVACGGGGSSTPKQPPVFSLATPGAASEGSVFTYTLQATDPSGGSVTFALVTAPSGATLSGATISWTPTHAQSRQTNNFTVKATSTSGETATASFVITPAGKIHGTDVVTTWGTYGVSKAVDLTGAVVQALVPDGANDTLVITGQGFSDGTFAIPNVPAGKYWLQVQTASSRGILLSTSSLYGTDANDIDIGYDIVQPGSTILSSGTSTSTGFGYPTATVNLDISGLDPWLPPTHVASSLLGNGGLIADSELGNNVLGFPNLTIPVGATSFTGQVQANLLSGMDPANGDSTYLVQYAESDTMASGSVSLVEAGGLVKALGPLSLAIDSATTSLDISGTFSSPNPGTLSMDVKAAGFEEFLSSVNPSARDLQFSAAALYEPTFQFPTSQSANIAAFGLLGPVTYTSPGAPLAYFSTSLNSSDLHLGTQGFSNPFSSGASPIFLAQQSAFVPLATADSGSGVGFSVGVVGAAGYYTTTPPTPDKPFDLPMLTVQNPQLNGSNLFTASSWSLPLNLSWSAPTGLPPAGYIVTLRGYGAPAQCLTTVDGGTACLPSQSQVMQFTTAETSLTIPTSLIRPGLSYAFEIRAIADSSTDFRVRPNRGSWNRAFSDVISSIIPPSSAVSQPTIAKGGSRSAKEFYIIRRDGAVQKACVKEGQPGFTVCEK